MKRVLVLLMAFVYLAVSSGFTMHLHYCMGHFVSASLVADTSDTHACTHCGMTKKKDGNGCCHDQHKIMKSSVDHQVMKSLQLPAPQSTFALLPPGYFPLIAAAFCPALPVRAAFSVHAPPGPGHCPLFLAVRNLRI